MKEKNYENSFDKHIIESFKKDGLEECLVRKDLDDAIKIKIYFNIFNNCQNKEEKEKGLFEQMMAQTLKEENGNV